MKLIWTVPAANDLDNIFKYIFTDNSSAAYNVRSVIRAEAESITAMPRRGRPGRLPGTRELILSKWPYIVVYQVEDDLVAIVRVRHAARSYP